MKRWTTALLALLIVVVSLPSVMALQETAQAPHKLDITGVNPNDGRNALVTVSVTDATGQSLSGLTPADFVLSGAWARAGATITNVESVTDDNLPLAVVLVIDTSSSMAGSPLALTKSAARSFIESLSANDTVAIISFNDDPILVQDYTTDRAALLSALDNLPFGGQTSLYDGAAVGVEVAARAPHPRRTVVLLSDGAEYGGASIQPREAGREAALVSGVPVYTIGLGFGTDRTYLRDLADSTNGRFYESPAPEDLPGIYNELAELFRSQYVLTTTFDGALDGTLYPFILSSAADSGVVDAATFRAPIPVPIVEITPALTAPLGSVTTFNARVRADSRLSSVTADFAGQLQTLTAPYRLTLDPFTLTPGDYMLTITAIDAEGDIGAAALPVSISPAQARLALDVDLTALGAISEPVTVNLNGETQSPSTGAEFRLDGETLGAGSGLPAQFVIDPITLTPGVRTVEFVVTEQSGTETTLAQSVEIAALPPLVSIEGLAAGDTLDSPRTVTVNLGGQSSQGTLTLLADGAQVDVIEGASPLTIEVDPLALFTEPGAHTLTLEVVNAFGQPATVELPVTLSEMLFPTPTPTHTATPTATPTETPDFEATAAVLTQAAQATADQAAAFIRATEASLATAAAQSTLDAQATLDTESTAAAQLALDTQATLAADATGTAAAAFADIALATAEAQATNEMQATIDGELAQLAAFTATAQANAQATLDTEALNAQATLDADATSAAQAALEAAARVSAAETALVSTRNAVQAAAFQAETATASAPTITPEPTATLTDEPTFTPTDEPTVTATDEPTATLTDEPTSTTTDEPTATLTLTATLEPTPTPFDPTSTPISLTDVVAEAAQTPQFTPIVALIIGSILLALIVVALIVLRRRRNE